MSDFQHDMNKAVEGFVAQITEFARRAALAMLESSFGAHVAGSGGRRTAPGLVTSSASVGRPRGRSGAKRSTEDLEALSTKFVAFVKAQPGLRIEQINKELGTVTKELALPIKKLIAEGMISAKGTKRSTQYFPGRKLK